MTAIDKYIQNSKLFLFVIVIVGILYFSCIPNSNLTSESYLPLWLRDWSNSYFNLRTAVPFVTFGFLLEGWLSLKIKLKKSKFICWFKNLCITTAIVCIAEGGQFFIMNRHPDTMDILFGVLGSQIGFFIFYLLHTLKVFLSIKE